MDLKPDTKDTNTPVQNEGDAKGDGRGQSIRESILAAVEEHSEDDSKPEIKEDKDAKDDDKVDDSTKKVDESKVDDKAIKDVDSTESKDKQVKEEKAPTFLPKEIQQDWDKIPINVRTHVTKIQKELADTKAEFGRKEAHFKDLSDAVAPYTASIQQLGLTPGQTVDRLFQWMNALSGPNKYEAIFELAKSFNIDMDSIYAGDQGQNNQQSQGQAQQQQQPQQDVDPRLAEAIYGMYSELNELKSHHQKQRQDSAANIVNNWAGLQADGTFSKKPYFSQVRQTMLGLLSSGAVPLVNGSLDLDTAYEQACYSNSEVRQELLAQQEKEKIAQAKQAAAKKAAEDAAKISKANKLNVSLRPTSPTGDIASRKVNANRGDKSIRSSIYEAIKEVNN